jgi:hypothetical protein
LRRGRRRTAVAVDGTRLSSKAPGRSVPLQVRQALLLGLAFNLYRGIAFFSEDVDRAILSPLFLILTGIHRFGTKLCKITPLFLIVTESFVPHTYEKQREGGTRS